MPDEIKYTEEELGLMAMFQTITGIHPRDCIIDDQFNRVIFIVDKGLIGLAIGKKGQTIAHVEKLVGRPVELVEYSDNPEEFIKNALGGRYIIDVKVTQRFDGRKVGVVTIPMKSKGAVLGKGGRNAEKARKLARRYFNIEQLHIVSQ
jgi:N utilization substance protein A